MKTTLEQLAIHGGPKAKPEPYGTGMRFVGNEMEYLRQALESNTLFFGFGQFVKRACGMMADYTGMPYVVACTSGSASIHLGLVAAGIGPGDEVITTPNTDNGTVVGVLLEGAVPVFCDCEESLQASARTVAEKITDRTRAVVVIHLAGHAAPVDEIVALCKPRGIAVIEDCAQSWGARLHGRQVGGFSTAGCFSTNDFKHISTGDGGFVALPTEDLYRRVANYADKFYDRGFDGTLNRQHFGMNYRMSELQGAVACAQLEQVETITARRHALGEQLREQCRDIPGLTLLEPIADSYSTYWWTAAFVDETVLTATRDEVVQALQAEGANLYSYGKYDLIDTGLFQTLDMRPWLQDARRYLPLQQPDGRRYSYTLSQTPIHQRCLQTGIQVQVGTFYTEQDIEETALAFRKVFTAFAR